MIQPSAVQQAVEHALEARDVIIEAAFRKEFGDPEDMTPEQMRLNASQCSTESKLVDGVNHFRMYREEGGVQRLLVEIVQTFDTESLSTTFRSEIGDLYLGEGDD